MIQILTIDSFDRELKRLAKKHTSLRTDLGKLLEELQETPTLGAALGHNAYKIRLAISSKNKGKSGGARVITYFVSNDDELYLLSIYDKSEQADIADNTLQQLIHTVLDSKT